MTGAKACHIGGEMDNIIIRSRKEEFKELVLYTVFGNMTFVISIGAYAI